ncbi:hypothetical protein VB715_09045 [Crocosphaera sp. UHCC 0190]|uniref:hypothetical protein n=1 Tax=Crocosphaera sp. UHCC 0190 TaxID=3110246 RepID=UPI002B220C40|nr:hypothetical protein [Crocosphaera sp. UHCC 0190]MEA5509909.1 hypothetical protein [Crocosphaera sp. UHCC 0190]
MSTLNEILSEISLVTANYNDGIVFADIIQDWFNFLGGKPGEVVVVDCGSNSQTQDIYWQLYKERVIDKLQVIQSDHQDNKEGKHSGYIKDYTAWMITSKPYVLLFRIDTLPYRNGYENWLEESINYLERDDVFAIGGSFNRAAKHHDAWPGWYFSHKCSHNFSLMKRSTLMSAIYGYASDYIISGFRSQNPSQAIDPRGVFELALEWYMEKHQMFTLCKIEDENWTVFHTNVHEERLKKTREKYLQRIDIERFMNAGLDQEEPIYGQGKYYGNFYGKPPVSLVKQIRINFGRSFLGSYWRNLKKQYNEPT